MNVEGRHYRTVWLGEQEGTVEIIDQRFLPFRFDIVTLRTVEETAHAIREMLVRGAGCIGAVAAHGMYIAAIEAAGEGDKGGFDELLRKKGEILCATRPTAVNLRWAVERQVAAIGEQGTIGAKVAEARRIAQEIADEDAEWCRRIGEHGLPLIREIAARKPAGEAVNILTHCNAGWLAFVDYGSATAQSMRPTMPAFPSMSGSTRPVPATRARVSPPGNWGSMVFPTRSS